jgi:PAS domain S-box-containing protein
MTTEDFEKLKKRNELILESAGEGIYGLDSRGLTTFVNPAAAKMIGWDPKELLGKSQHKVLHHSRADGSPYPAPECPIYDAFKDGKVHTVKDEVFWRKDGSSFPVEYVSTPIKEKGKLVGAVVVFRDVTKEREDEEKLKNAYAEVTRLKEQLELDNVYLREEIKHEYGFTEIMGKCAAIKKVLKKIEQVGVTNSTVLILGETGTGKELIARALHNISPRSGRPLVKVNCSALPENLVESELFGHEKGAFTGAISKKIGRFELADGGTIFLDEIGDLKFDLQAKLLRVLQEGEFERIGNPVTIKVDTRIIAATNLDLERAIEKREFREDLFYRLNVFPINSPPLRERKEDIPLLVSHFCDKLGPKVGKKINSVSKLVMNSLVDYSWPGNVRELENIIERAVILSENNKLEAGDWIPADEPGAQPLQDVTTLEECERRHIVKALELTGWRVSGQRGAAGILGLNPSTLQSRIKKLGISKS